MSQKQSDSSQKQFSVGRGLLAAAETLNFNVNEQRPGRPMGGVASGMGMGIGVGEGPDGSSQIPRRSGGGGNLGSTMKLFASLGLSPSDLDALAKIPEEEISVETLPRILMLLKSSKGEAGERRSSDAYPGGRDGWEEGPVGRMGGPSVGEARAPPPSDFGFTSMQDTSSGRGYGSGYGGGRTERPFSELSQQSSYSGLGMGPSQSDQVFMQRRMGSPSNGKVQDFLGVMPPMFPHVCSLCDFDVHSTMEWNQHINGLRHAENRRLLLDMYPDWNPGMASGSARGLRDTPNLSAGLLGPGPVSMSSGQMGGMSSSWGGGGPGLSGNKLGQNTMRSRVVVVKYDRKPLSNKTLFAFTEPFGRLREHLVLKNKAFLEMNSHEEARDMVNYYKQHPASLYGKTVTFYLSQRLMVIEKDQRALDRPIDRPLKGHGSKVVFFSNLPREEEKKKELLTIAERFGVVDKHLFLTDQAFVQLGTAEDAEMLVKYYSVNPLTIRGRMIRLNICAKYKTLNVNRRQGGSGGDPQNRRSTRTTEASEEDEEEVVTGVVQGGDDEEEPIRDAEEEPETTELEKDTKEEESEEVKHEEEEQVPDIAADAPEDLEKVEEDGVKQGAESEGPADASADKHKNKDETGAEPGEPTESSETVEGELPDEDFLENMEDFVTLDELDEDEGDAHRDSDSTDNTKKGGMRVVNIIGFRRGYNFMDELLGLAKPFGKVVKHLVLDLRPEAYIQFETEEEARSMSRFYNSNVSATVCGRPVRVCHSLSYPTIQCGSSKVVYIGQLPNTKYMDDDILKLAEPYGKVHKYFLNRIRRECFLEMERAEDAEKMAEDCKAKPPRFSGKRLTIYVSRKYRQLKHGHRFPSTSKRSTSGSPPTSSQHGEEPPAKKPREEEEARKEEEQDEKKEQEEEEKGVQGDDTSSDVKMEENSAQKLPEDSDEKQNVEDEKRQEMETSQNGEGEAPPPADSKGAAAAALPLPPYDPDAPIGSEHVKKGFYCRVCFLFYTNEDTAKKSHCSSRAHYDKLQKYLEKEQTKEKKKKKTSAMA
ncbi:matrin 3-like 1.2 [Xenentodon cancila]